MYMHSQKDCVCIPKLKSNMIVMLAKRSVFAFLIMNADMHSCNNSYQAYRSTIMSTQDFSQRGKGGWLTLLSLSQFLWCGRRNAHCKTKFSWLVQLQGFKN